MTAFFSRIATENVVTGVRGENVVTAPCDADPQIDHKQDKRPVSVSSIDHCPTLRKGQKVNLRSGRTATVEGESQHYFWAVKESLPYSKNEIVYWHGFERGVGFNHRNGAERKEPNNMIYAQFDGFKLPEKLPAIDMSKADLRGANISNADLSGIKINKEENQRSNQNERNI